MTAEAILPPSLWVASGSGSGTEPDMTGGFRIAGGVVAHNEESRLEPALRSLLDQDLPAGVEWSRIWVVASGCTDRTVEVARELAQRDERVAVIVEAERRGKAHALSHVFRRAEGDAVVLLNADAVAEPGAVRELLRIGRDAPAPYAVMARPVIGESARGEGARSLELMWELHHRFHAHLRAEGGGSHLSDELLLVSLDPTPPLPEGVVNDGSYFGVWLARHSAPRRYADRARVRIVVPTTWRDHLLQRRRIRYGNVQVQQLLGEGPSTLVGYSLEHPSTAFGILREATRASSGGWAAFAPLLAAELFAHGLAIWDRLPPERDHVRWRRIRDPVSQPEPGVRLSGPPEHPTAREAVEAELKRRVATLVAVGEEFGAPVSVAEMLPLLPPGAPRTPVDLHAWLDLHPEIRLPDRAGGTGTDHEPGELERRRERGRAYLEHAERMLDGPLRAGLRWVRTIAITGSTAYGSPGADDDLDLFVVCRRGAVHLFLAVAYLNLRRARRCGEVGARPVLCLNFVVDERRASAEFEVDRGLLFAREALSARPVVGEAYYRGLLAGAPWIRERAPGLYTDRSGGPWDLEERPAPWPARLANALMFLPLAAYLQLVGLARNHRMRRHGQQQDRFRTLTAVSRVAFVSHRFERLRAMYDGFGAGTPERGDKGSPLREPVAAR